MRIKGNHQFRRFVFRKNQVWKRKEGGHNIKKKLSM